ncbi:MAG: MFS transporter, partial [Nitrospinota bacterium]
MRLEKKWLALLGTSPGVFMSTVDSSIVNISLPTLARAFEVDLPSVRWVMMGYLLTISGLLLAAGRLADLAGRKRVFLHGLRLFTLSSFLCALAGGVGWLVSFRVLQGVGASMIMAVSPAIVVAAFPPSERGTGLGVASMVVGVGLSLGPTLGGFLTAYLGWRSIFFVNVPVGILGILLASRVLDRDEPAGEGSLDLLGAALLALGIVPLVWGLSQEQQAGWTSAPVAGAIALGALALAAFAWAELRAEGPILELRLFAEPLFGASTVGI